MLYTVVSLGDIFYTEPRKNKNVPLENGFAVVNENNAVESVFSTNPFDYLSESFTRGTALKYYNYMKN